MKYLLDTHTWIWWHMNPKKLSAKVGSLIQDAAKYEEMLLSAISPWEFGKLLEKKKIGISYDPEEWLQKAIAMPKLRLVHISPKIAYCSTMLPRPFHDDPADQIIVATARQEGATILTRDGRLLDYLHVKSMW